MTREEAITILDRRTTIPGDGYSFESINKAIDTAISALRPITRDQVEKMRGAWVYMTDDDGCTWTECSKCEHELDSLEEPQNFCPHCGSPMTDEAVDILWARLEAMWDEQAD